MTLYTITQQGAPIVNSAYIRRQSDDIVCIEVDMTSKNCEVAGTSAGTLCVVADEDSLYLADVSTDGPTEVRFAAPYDGWEVFATGGGRYTISVCLIRPGS